VVSHEPYRVVDAYYTVETDGYPRETPVVHLFGRDETWRRHHWRVDDFDPYFTVSEDAYLTHGEQLDGDDRVTSIQFTDERDRPETGLFGDGMVRVCVRTPGHVSKLRELFPQESLGEADVLYPVRFLVDRGIRQWFVVQRDNGTGETPSSGVEPQGSTSPERVSSDAIYGFDHPDCPATEPPDSTPPVRVVTYDIEVEQGGDGPPVVTERGTEQARNPITAISAHDSYADEYHVWVLAHSGWNTDDSERARDGADACPVEADLHIHENPRSVVSGFVSWLTDIEPDVLTGWNANSFDHPYLVNWCLRHDVTSVFGLSPTRDVRSMNGDGSWINSSLKGRLLTDLLEMYKKSNVHELSSYRLEDVAEAEELDVEKLSIDDVIEVPRETPAIDYAWANHPDVFVRYALLDTVAAVGINRESQEQVHIV
jgi:DNA polymerase elongation subunit (family B)